MTTILAEPVLSVLTLPVVPGWLPKIQLLELSGPAQEDCQIDAANDVEAARIWVGLYQDQPKTWNAYKREVERLLLWCTYEKGLCLKQLKVHDFEDYFKFLQNLPHHWRTTRAKLRQGREDPEWRPFLGSLNPTAFLMAVRVLNSFMNYLVEAGYLNTNPIKLIKKYQKTAIDWETAQYQVWERMLEGDEWAAIQETLQNMPEDSTQAIANKMRVQFLFALLYLLGLRIEEVVTHGWNAFRKQDGKWWMFVRGKGNKLRHIPVNDQLLSYIKVYRLSLKKDVLPKIDEQDPLFLSKKTGKALSIRQTYTLVKTVGRTAMQQFKDDPAKAERLRRFSTHWLRHMSASHQDKEGFSERSIQDNLGHRSLGTTKIYRHVENERRHAEMQKLKLAVEPRLIKVKSENTEILLSLYIKGGPIGEGISLHRLLDYIERYVWQGMEWQRVGFSREQIVKSFEAKKRFGEGVEIQYQLGNVNTGTLEVLKRALVRECEIRLFEVVISEK